MLEVLSSPDPCLFYIKDALKPLVLLLGQGVNLYQKATERKMGKKVISEYICMSATQLVIR